MNYQISNRMAAMKPSMVREILKASSNPEVIALSAGNPSVDAFPVEWMQKAVGEIMEENPVLAMQYSLSEGYGPLREALWKLCENRYQIPRREMDELMVVSGAQQGLDLFSKCLLNEGDVILCEEPSFIGALNCFRSYGAKLSGVPMEQDGVDLNALEQEMKKPNVKAFYIIPNFQNPSGITTSLEKRKAILALAQKYNVVILEDNPYGDLRFAGEPIPPIKQFDTEGVVVYIGSFSKILAPALRVGFVIAPKSMMAPMVVGKQCTDVHTSMLPQLLCLKFLQEVDLQAHLNRVRSLYGEKCKLMSSIIDEQWNPQVKRTSPEGGLFLWCTLPQGKDMMRFCQQAAQEKVTVVPGVAFLSEDTRPCQSFRMCYATPTKENIEVGVRKLSSLTF